MATKHPLDIYFCVPGLPFNGDTLKTKSLGGSESAGAYLARELGARGHRVRVFSNCGPGTEVAAGSFDGVEYIPLPRFEGFATKSPSDVVVVQRVPELLSKPFMTKVSVLWCHDLALKRAVPGFRSTQWNCDHVAVLSEFMAAQYREIFGVPESQLFLTRNGVEPALLQGKPLHGGGEPFAARDRDAILYAARPERGLDVMLTRVFPEILKHRPTAKLLLCSYDNPVNVPWYAEINALKANFPPGSIVELGSLSKADLFKVMRTAGAYVYPVPGDVSPSFAEVSCIAALEAQANGLPFFGTLHGALPETAKASRLFHIQDRDSGAMAKTVCDVLNDEAQYSELQRAQWEHVQRYNWATIAEEWEAKFFETIAKNNDDPVRLASWFFQRSDIEAAELALADESATGPIADRLRAEIDQRYAFRKSEEALAAHYLAMGVESDLDLTKKDGNNVFNRDGITLNPEPRFHFMASAIREALGGIEERKPTILDAGCGHGWSSIYMANNLKLPVYGFDVDPGAIKWASHLASKYADDQKQSSRFTTNKKLALKKWSAEVEGFDAAICSEVLEHVVDPIAFLTEVEAAVRPGGLIVITVPLGPWEFGGPHWTGKWRAHIREFNQADVHDMLGHKPEFKSGAVVTKAHEKNGEACGFIAVTYRADHSPIRPIDYERKLLVQRPRQTVSANMLVGPGSEETIEWSLSSLKWVVDDVVAVDCGASQETLDALAKYGARVFKSPSPLDVGFDTARNVGLINSVTDWVLWIDSDERLTEPHELGRYLRANLLSGYTLQQNHFAVDTPIPADTPVRLIRNKIGLRFFGHIHEHPETAINKGPGLVAMVQSPQLAHVGYISNSQRAGRFFRNRPMMEMDRQRYPNRVMGYHLEARDLWLVLNEGLARNNGEVTSQMVPIAQEIVRQCKMFYAADIPLMGIDPRPFLTTALRILGVGFDAEVQVRIGRDNVGDPPTEASLRFESVGDFKAHLERLTKDKLAAVADPMF
jgi:glycosyltransferase involved in cell wall biosynthesis/SAM-dependent methyltransferase